MHRQASEPIAAPKSKAVSCDVVWIHLASYGTCRKLKMAERWKLLQTAESSQLVAGIICSISSDASARGPDHAWSRIKDHASTSSKHLSIWRIWRQHMVIRGACSSWLPCTLTFESFDDFCVQSILALLKASRSSKLDTCRREAIREWHIATGMRWEYARRWDVKMFDMKWSEMISMKMHICRIATIWSLRSLPSARCSWSNALRNVARKLRPNPKSLQSSKSSLSRLSNVLDLIQIMFKWFQMS